MLHIGKMEHKSVNRVFSRYKERGICDFMTWFIRCVFVSTCVIVIIFLYDNKYIIPNQHDFSIDIAKEFHPNITNTDKLDVVSFGHNPWDGIPLADWFSVFRRDVAILSNDGGMRLPHQFAVYTVLRLLQPKIVIESGVWNGVVTKVIRKTLPKAYIISVDPSCRTKEQSSDNHEVICGKNFKDFKYMSARWSTIDKEHTLILFDDHQSGFLRTIQAEQFGFKYIMIDDNPSMGVGDNYSPKQVLSSVKTDSVLYLDNFGRTKKIISQDKHYENQKLFKQLVKTYVEFPPLDKNLTVELLSKNVLASKSGISLSRDENIDYYWRKTPRGLGIHNLPFDKDHFGYCWIAFIEIK